MFRSANRWTLALTILVVVFQFVWWFPRLPNLMPAHFDAWCEALATFGAGGVFKEDVFFAMGGRPTKDIVVDLNSEYNFSTYQLKKDNLDEYIKKFDNLRDAITEAIARTFPC